MNELPRNWKMLIKHPRFIATIGGILVVVFGISVYAFFDQSRNITKVEMTPTQEPAVTLTSTTTTSLTPTDTPSPTGTPLPPRSGLSVYTSAANHLSFYYSNNGEWSVKEQGNVITIYKTSDPTVQQSVELFSKYATETIQQAITKTFLVGYNPSDCPITLPGATDGYKFPSNMQTASLGYNSSNTNSTGTGPVDTSKCPIKYTVLNGMKYFLVESTHSEFLAFFNIGQFQIPAGTDTVGKSIGWQDTIVFL